MEEATETVIDLLDETIDNNANTNTNNEADENAITDNNILDISLSPIKCPVCGEGFESELTFSDHYSINHEDAYNDISFMCHICADRFNSQFDLNSHITTCHNNASDDIVIEDVEDIDIEDDINNTNNEAIVVEDIEVDLETGNQHLMPPPPPPSPIQTSTPVTRSVVPPPPPRPPPLLNTNRRSYMRGYFSTYSNPMFRVGRYACPNCSRRFSTQGLLGEHFIRFHNDYEQMMSLDNNISKNKTLGWPGFELLEKIKMIKRLSKNKQLKLIQKNESCGICYQDYKFKENPIKISFNLEKECKIDGSVSDDEYIYDSRNVNHKTLFNCGL